MPLPAARMFVSFWGYQSYESVKNSWCMDSKGPAAANHSSLGDDIWSIGGGRGVRKAQLVSRHLQGGQDEGDPIPKVNGYDDIDIPS